MFVLSRKMFAFHILAYKVLKVLYVSAKLYITE